MDRLEKVLLRINEEMDTDPKCTGNCKFCKSLTNEEMLLFVLHAWKQIAKLEKGERVTLALDNGTERVYERIK